MRSPRRLLVPIHLDREGDRPLQDQLAAQLREAIDAGRLGQGTRMPSTRTLAGILRVSRGVVVTAYERLHAAGYVTGRTGSGTYVARRGASTGPGAVHEPDELPLISLEPDRPSPEGFPLAAWRAAWRRASHHAPPVEDLPAAGLPELRAAVAGHLRDSRGLVTDGHEVIITLGYGHALQLLLSAAGARLVAVEDPAPPPVRAAVRRHARVLPLPVDRDGAQVGLIPKDCDVAVVMPERNDPLGVRMSRERRRAMAEHGCLVLEPGFDGHADASLGPEPSILSLGDPGRTAMIGTFGALLTNALPMAYLLVPRRLAPLIRAQIAAAGEQPAFLAQRALADLLATGCVARRIDRLSALYAAKRTLVRHALAGRPGVRLAGADGGSSVTLLLPEDLPAERFAGLLRERNVQVATLDRYCDARPRNGLVLGYGHLDDMALHRALRVLTRTLAEQGLPGFRHDAA
ncbi:PLP-dependent aminotransferase family protein [Nonomuraea sp. NPDC050310]|uniref:aminotransferase-like domain-containing protein n=1 Tax=Nonomuraea sp. NPDC050310 TaxID=3154935 RepID=UPI0033EC1D3C